MSDTVAITARRLKRLVGVAYGHGWNWGSATDDWSLQLRPRLGVHARTLDNSFAVNLLAVTPQEAGSGLGQQLLNTLLSHDNHSVAWLQTTDLATPARRLYERSGWVALGHGPDAPNGAPGLVMVHYRN